MKILPCGDTALLLDCDSLAEALSWHREIAAANLDMVDDLVPAARTVLVRVGDAAAAKAAERAIRAREPPGAAVGEKPSKQDPIELPVSYDGADLEEVGRLSGLGAEGVVEAHTAQAWRVAFCGFAPGSGYLVGDDGRLHVPRRDHPRTRVPAGAVGLACEFSGVYPRESPGGWQADRPHRRGVMGRGAATSRAATAGPAGAFRGGPVLIVLATGPLATVQDQGRVGHAALGVSRSGAADRASLRLANRLVGNAEDAAGIEVTFGGRAEAPHLVAVTGATGPVEVDGRPAAHGEPLRLRAGSMLRLGPPVLGLRTYVGVAGGIAVPAVLGCRSTDTLSGVGPDSVHEGSQLPVGDPSGATSNADAQTRLRQGELRLRITLGPRDDWFGTEAVERLLSTAWQVGTRADRVGLRLDGPTLKRCRKEELPSEGCIRGALQVSADGTPILLGADHPVTGGYPVIAVVVDADCDLVAQLRPGERMRFSRV